MKIHANHVEVEAKKGDTILEALERANVKVPTLCHLKGSSPSGACRMCVVEVEGMPALVPACSYPAADGMKILTHSSRVLDARKTIVELLLSGHPDDCLYCSGNRRCQLQKFAEELGVRDRSYSRKYGTQPIDISSPSITRDHEKCVLCGKCVRVCEEIQSVSAIDFIKRGSKAHIGTAFDKGLNVSSCINCGQCIMVCPTGSLSEKSCVDEVIAALSDKSKFVVVQHAPSISVSLADEFGFKSGKDIDGQMVAALKMMGFKKVFDTSFSADLTIMEEASELVHRVTNKGVLPLMTSCSPGWIKFVEQFYPEFLPNISTCKSPQQMLGALIKRLFAKKQGLNPKDIVSVSIMPCTAKKFECNRDEMSADYIQDVDYVLTTRELARIIRMFGIDVSQLEPAEADSPFGERSTAGKIFGATGGVMEAAVRTAYFMITGKEMEDLDVIPVRGLKGIKGCTLDINGLKVGAAVVHGLGNAREMLEELKNGRSDLHFIEVMTCPGGCIAGGGQPLSTDLNAIKERMKSLYNIDKSATLRLSHKNKEVQKLYDEYLTKPLSKLSHELLHTHYHKRNDVIL